MRIGTWNLAGRWSENHLALLVDAGCDVWLLTEVDERTELPGHDLHLSSAHMALERRWAGIASRLPMAPEPDPHPASARARIGSATYVSSVLPWRACGSEPPWVGDRHADKTQHAVAELMDSLRGAQPLVWGGDWNHALSGREYAGSQGGRRAILEALDQSALRAPTAELPHAIDGLLTIDHVAVPLGWVSGAARMSASREGVRLSDHDAYVIDVPIV